MSVYIFLAEGFEEIEAIAVIDTLRRGRIDIKSVSISDDKEVVGRSGIKVVADLLFDRKLFENAEMLVIPGGMLGSQNLSAHDGLTSLLSEFNEKGKYLAAICAGPLVLGKIGILKGRQAICYAGLECDLPGAVIKDERVVHDRNIITSKGPGTAIEFSLKLVEVLLGKDISDKIKAGMLV
jgi:4-methyl-5(b-hydroxyethyl)-thiazole monophosphate biosynthesis